MRKIKESAPGKLMLFGEHAVVYNQPCLAAAMDKWVTVTTIEKKGEESVFVKTTRQLFEQKFGAVSVGFRIDGFNSRYGLGSSAAVTVATAKALFKLKNIKVSQKELFDFCYQVVRKVQEVGSGFDLAASIYGGVIYFVTGGKNIQRLSVQKVPLIVGYSGEKADTIKMIKQTAKKINQHFLQQSTKIVNKAKAAMEREDWLETGRLMNQNQEILKGVGVSTPKLDKMVEASLKAGAWGGKLSGAGGGDCMIALTSDNKRMAVEKAIELAGGEIIRVKLSL
ncbi:MAG: hypothetical protein U0946_00740 [Patescibacteria group bacterium]|nr:hypothetical protein [Patescibacteria group bacterium]